MKYKVAICNNQLNQQETITVQMLNNNPNLISELKRYELFDYSEEIELSIVDNTTNNKSSHFRTKHNNLTHKEYYISGNDSEKHNLQILKLYDFFTENNQISVIFNDLSIYPMGKCCLVEVKNYTFKIELTRETEINKPYARYDLYGIDRNLCVTSKKPEFIIEVIDTHFQNKDLFNFLLNKTKNSSIIIIYIYLNNYYNVIENNQLRISSYIKNGTFYHCGIPLTLPKKELNNIDNPYHYYNFVEKHIIIPIQKQQKIDVGFIKNPK